MRYVLGFDGGGTKTECVLMDETGAILARSRSGASNPTTFGEDTSLASLTHGAADALRAAGKSKQDVAYLVAGISGAGEPAMRWALQSGLQPKLPNAKICVTSDLVLSFPATGQIPSALVIAGTGSAALARTTPSKFARARGHRPATGDTSTASDVSTKAAS